MNEVAIAGIATTSLVAAVAAASTMYPDWLTGVTLYDMLATMVLGILGNFSREIYQHYDPESPIETNPIRLIAMVIPGIFGGVLGGEIASLAGFDEGTWLFAATLGYLGNPAMEKVTTGIMGLMDKALGTIGVRQDKAAQYQMEMDEKRHQALIKSLNEPL